LPQSLELEYGSCPFLRLGESSHLEKMVGMFEGHTNPSMTSLAYPYYLCIVPETLGMLLKQKKFWLAVGISIPCGVIGAAFKYARSYIDESIGADIMTDNAPFEAITVLLIFLVAFRLQTAYGKFWDGCDHLYLLVGDLFDTMSDCLAFTSCSKADPQVILEFQHLIVRLCSLLNSCIFAALEAGSEAANGLNESAEEAELPKAYDFEILDIQGIDEETLERFLEADNKVEVVFLWIQMLLVENQANGVISVPPPLLARAFINLGSALVHFHEAQRITEVPFPFAVTMAVQLLLCTHWICAPVVVAMWTEYVAWTVGFCVAQTFSLWFFIAIATELDQPFQHTQNSPDMRYLQQLLNHRMLTILDHHTKKMDNPQLSLSVNREVTRATMADGAGDSLVRTTSIRKTMSARRSDPDNQM